MIQGRGVRSVDVSVMKERDKYGILAEKLKANHLEDVRADWMIILKGI
jgi:hypothetical protein